MKPRKFKEGILYRVRFTDHCIGKYDAMLCEAVGWCIKDAIENVVLTPWQVLTDDAEIRKNNVEPYSIIKSTIKSSRKLG